MIEVFIIEKQLQNLQKGIYYDNVSVYLLLKVNYMANLRDKIAQDYNTISSTTTKSTLSGIDLQGAIAYAKDELRKIPTDPTLKSWLTIIAQRESENTEIRSQLDDLKDFLDAQGKRIIPAPVFDAPTTKSPEAKNIIFDIDTQIQKWELTKNLDVMTMDKLESSLKYTESIAKLIPISHTALGRWVVGSIMLGRLQELGYHVWVNADGTVFVGSTHKDAIDVENKINAQIKSPGSVMSDIIRSGMLSMSPTFRQYASSKTIDGKATPPQKPDDYKKYLDLKMSQDPKWAFTFSDASFISSYTKGGFNNYDFATMMSQSRDLQKVWAFVESHPAIVAQVESLTASPSIVSSIIIAPAVVSSAPDTKAGKAAWVAWETIGTVAWATGAVIWTVATETVSTWSTILSEATKTGWAMWAIGVIGLLIGSIWKFGFWKTMMGVVGIWWASAIANAAENGTFDKLADKMKKGGDKLGQMADKVTGNTTSASTPQAAPAAQPAAAPVVATIEDQYQKSISDKIRTNSEFKTFIDSASLPGKKKNANLDKYLSFINTDLKDKSAEAFYNPKDINHSIFINTNLVDPSIVLPPDFDPAIFKNIMRMYITGTYMSNVKMNDPANLAIIKTSIWKVTQANATLAKATELIQQ